MNKTRQGRLPSVFSLGKMELERLNTDLKEKKKQIGKRPGATTRTSSLRTGVQQYE